MVVFGEQKKHRLSRTLLSLFFNSFIVFVIHTNPLSDFKTGFMVTNSLIILLSFATSLGVTNWLLNEDDIEQSGVKPNTHWKEIVF